MTLTADDDFQRPLVESVNFAYAESIGKRSRQEDYCLFQLYSRALGPRLLAVIADGMGGHAGGAEASRLAVDSFVSHFDTRDESLSLEEAFEHGVRASNGLIASAQVARPELAEMGCTLVGLYVQGRQYQWVSIGDSPLFLYRDGRLTRLNADHSMAPMIADAVRKGKLTAEEAQEHPGKNALRSAIMGKTIDLIDLSMPHAFLEGDVLILASDGLLTLALWEMEDVLVESPRNAKVLAERLLAAVISKNKPRQDNTTIMVISPGACLFSPEMKDKFPLSPRALTSPRSTKPHVNWYVSIPQIFVAASVGIILSLAGIYAWFLANERTSIREIATSIFISDPTKVSGNHSGSRQPPAGSSVSADRHVSSQTHSESSIPAPSTQHFDQPAANSSN